MELPQPPPPPPPPPPLPTEGRKPTHDFLSLYTHSNPHPHSFEGRGGYLKTHDFLRPLEEKTMNVTSSSREGAAAAPHNCCVEGVLGGGIGSYSISHISYFNPEAASDHQFGFTSRPSAVKEDELVDDRKPFLIKKESSSPSTVYAGELRIKGCDQKANTPRSKHSATEQRRRSKINDRFKKLRELIPRSDQKRDKASFLLEVIHYVQFLQEKVGKYESSPPHGWHPGRSNCNPPQSQVANTGPPPFMSHSMSSHNPVESEVRTCTTFIPGKTKLPSPYIATAVRNMLKEREQSSACSEDLLKILTQALQSSGVDMSEASIGVQIEVGKRKNSVFPSEHSLGAAEEQEQAFINKQKR